MLKQIKQHPDYKKVKHSPDFTVADAIAALEELRTEIQE